MFTGKMIRLPVTGNLPYAGKYVTGNASGKRCAEPGVMCGWCSDQAPRHRQQLCWVRVRSGRTCAVAVYAYRMDASP